MTPSLAHEPRSREQTTGIVRDVLGTAVLGTYLYGSAVGGGLRSGSDLDIMVVSNRLLTGDERSAIIERLLPISGRGAGGGPARPIELTIISRSALTPWRYPPSLELQYGDWTRAAFDRGKLPDWPRADPDVAILIETARRAAVPLIGPPVGAIIEPVPRAVRAMVDSIPVLMPGIEEGTDIRNGLLSNSLHPRASRCALAPRQPGDPPGAPQPRPRSSVPGHCIRVHARPRRSRPGASVPGRRHSSKGSHATAMWLPRHP